VRILVTGGAGFIGTRAVRALVAAGHDIDAVSHQAAMVGLGAELADMPDYSGATTSVPPCCSTSPPRSQRRSTARPRS
jgi:NAD(P)-dependent dehydrogenase (short-subunit alcohol dehydrogenase family)